MISPELIRRFPFFSGLTPDHIVVLAKVANEMTIEAGHYFFHEDDELDTFYLVLEGEVSILIELREKKQEVVSSTIRPVDVFAWSALVPPHRSTAAAKAATNCRIVAFDCAALWPYFNSDPHFAFLMTQRAAQGFRERLKDTRIESLVYVAE